MSKQLLVMADTNFRITVPDGASITFGPWSPPGSGKTDRYAMTNASHNGTLRIYEGSKSTSNIIGVFSGVTGFRDLSLDYAEEVAVEKGAIIWSSDKDGYQREERVNRASDFTVPQLASTAKTPKARKGKEIVDELGF